MTIPDKYLGCKWHMVVGERKVVSPICRVPTVPGKPRKMMIAFPFMEISSFKILKNMEKWEEETWKNKNFSYCYYTFQFLSYGNTCAE